MAQQPPRRVNPLLGNPVTPGQVGGNGGRPPLPVPGSRAGAPGFDPGGPADGGKPGPTTQGTASLPQGTVPVCCPETNSLLTELRDLLQQILITQEGAPITDVDEFPGSLFSDGNWHEVYSNETTRSIRVKALIEWGIPGAGIRFAIVPAISNRHTLDLISNSATNGGDRTEAFVIPPKHKLYARSWKTDAPSKNALDDTTTVRIREFDPQAIRNDY